MLSFQYSWFDYDSVPAFGLNVGGTPAAAAAAAADGPTTPSIATAANCLTVYVHLPSSTPILILVLILIPTTLVAAAINDPTVYVRSLSMSTKRALLLFLLLLSVNQCSFITKSSNTNTIFLRDQTTS